MREIRGGVFQDRFHNLLISKNNTFWAPQISRITFQVVRGDVRRPLTTPGSGDRHPCRSGPCPPLRLLYDAALGALSRTCRARKRRLSAVRRARDTSAGMPHSCMCLTSAATGSCRTRVAVEGGADVERFSRFSRQGSCRSCTCQSAGTWEPVRTTPLTRGRPSALPLVRRGFLCKELRALSGVAARGMCLAHNPRGGSETRTQASCVSGEW
jgi:hypothetical protein